MKKDKSNVINPLDRIDNLFEAHTEKVAAKKCKKGLEKSREIIT